MQPRKYKEQLCILFKIFFIMFLDTRKFKLKNLELFTSCLKFVISLYIYRFYIYIYRSGKIVNILQAFSVEYKEFYIFLKTYYCDNKNILREREGGGVTQNLGYLVNEHIRSCK